MSLPLSLSLSVLWLLVLLQGVILLGLVRVVYQMQHAGPMASPHGDDGALQIGQKAPHFLATDLNGALIDMADFAGQLTGLLFVSPNCPSCMTTLAEMDALAWKAQGNVIVVCQADTDECARVAKRYGITAPVVADTNNEIGRRFQITGVPTAVLIDESNRIESYGHPLRQQDFTDAGEDPRNANALAGK